MSFVVSSAAGPSEDTILDARLSLFAGALRFRITPYDFARERYYALFVNGRYAGTWWAPAVGDIEGTLPFEPGNTIASLYAEDVGDCESFDGYALPVEGAEYAECLTANRLKFEWRAGYKITAVTGDAQLASIVVTGAARDRNVEPLPDYPQRGRLYYTITTASSGDYVVRWWAGQRLMAEGSRAGDGAVSCVAMNASGLSVTCTLTYTGDVRAGAAYLDACWPKSFQLHYSTGALAYPRAPEATQQDNGAETYVYLSPVLTAGAYNYNVTQINDDGTAEAAPAPPADSPVTIAAAPAAPAVTMITGQAGARTNLCLYSEQLNTAPWAVGGAATVTANAAAAPDGNTTADKVIGATIGDTVNQSIAVAALTNYTLSLYAKNNTGVAARLQVWDETNSAEIVTLNFFAQISTTAWARVTQAFATPAGCVQISVRPLAPAGIAAHNYYVWGVQLETGAAATGYLPTAGVSTTGALAVFWTPGETGCSYALYHSLVNMPVNTSASASPAPVTTAVGATSAVTPAITGYATVDDEADYNTLATAWDSAIATCNTAFGIGEAGFAAALDALEAALLAAVTTYEAGIAKHLGEFRSAVVRASDVVELRVDSVASLSLSATNWKNNVGPFYAAYLARLGAILCGERGRYTLPNAALAGGALPSASTGTGAGKDGTSGEVAPTTATSLKTAGQPWAKPGRVRLFVRATKAAVEERGDASEAVELDDTGAIVNDHPNAADIEAVTCAGSTTITATIGVVEDDAAATATHVDLYVVAVGASFNWSSAQASAALPAAFAGYHKVNVSYDTGGAGWYRITAKARVSSTGARSEIYRELRRYVGAGEPGAVAEIQAKAVRGRGVWAEL